MLLTIDVGNTQTVLGLFEGPQIVEHWRLATDPRRTADELALLVGGLLDSSGHRSAVAGISACSTVPAVLNEVRTMCARWFADLPIVIVEPGTRTGVPVLTDNPKEVGSDRIVNTLAAFTLHPGPSVVVDFGTATTFDAVSERGEFLGGAFAPGIEISVDALASRAAQLLKVQLVRPRSVIGKNTVEALQSGILYGFAAQVDGITERIVAELGPSTTVIATGGLAPVVLEECRRIDVHEPWLTLIGLRLVFERNV
ncbi:MAG: type pantothenate kinase [Actinomycetota bacterium]|jgi:type III pantothenate kinase|nr:type pantothenate kinase [Actinomycetota bacterium]